MAAGSPAAGDRFSVRKNDPHVTQVQGKINPDLSLEYGQTSPNIRLQSGVWIHILIVWYGSVPIRLTETDKTGRKCFTALN